jgi:hypothetical protein
MDKSWRVSFVAASVALILSGCGSTPPKADQYIPPPMGSTWVWNVTSSGSYGQGKAVPVTMRVTPVEWEGKALLKFESASGGVLQDRNVGVVAALDPAGRAVMRYDPPLSYEWPLEVGRTWTQQHTLTVASGQKFPMTSTWKVEAYEDVTVPAGTFKAFRLSMADSFGFKQTTWSVPTSMGVFAKRINARPPGHPQGEGTQLFELASVPTVR